MFVRFQTVGKVTWSVLTGFSSLPGDPAPADPAPTALLALGLTLPTNQPPPPGAFGNFWTHFWLSQLGAGGSAFGIYWGEIRDAAKHPWVHGAAAPQNIII